MTEWPSNGLARRVLRILRQIGGSAGPVRILPGIMTGALFMLSAPAAHAENFLYQDGQFYTNANEALDAIQRDLDKQFRLVAVSPKLPDRSRIQQLSSHTDSIASEDGAQLTTQVSQNRGLVTWPTKSFDATSLVLRHIAGSVTVDVQEEPGPMKLDVSGAPQRLDRLDVSARSSMFCSILSCPLVVDASRTHDQPMAGELRIKVTVPIGTSVTIQGFAGRAQIGDTRGALFFTEVASSTIATLGQLAKAELSLKGGSFDIAGVSGSLDITIDGSAHVRVGQAGQVRANIDGAGDIALGPVADSLSVNIRGAGGFSAASVNGATDVKIDGAGSGRIGDGIANPLHVTILGAGQFYLGGVAVDPDIEGSGTGQARLRSYRGQLRTSGKLDTKIED